MKTDSKKIKILFCGLGSIGQRHLRNTISILGNRAVISAFRQRNSSPVLNPNMTVKEGESLAEVYPIKEFYNLDEALQDSPDIVFITNPNSEHLRIAILAAKRGCNLFIEKPVSHNLEGIAELRTLVEEKKIKVFVAYQFRYHPAMQQIKEWLQKGLIGTTLSAHIVNAEYLPDWHPYEDYTKTHPIWKNLGGGCHHIQTHELDYALWLFGNPETVYAQGGKLSRLAGDAVDTIDILMNCNNNHGMFPVHIHLDYLQWPHKRYCEIIGDLGKIEFDYYKNELALYITEGRITKTLSFESFERNNMFLTELKSFFKSVDFNEETEINLEEGLRSVVLSSAIDRSLLTGEKVQLNG